MHNKMAAPIHNFHIIRAQVIDLDCNRKVNVAKITTMTIMAVFSVILLSEVFYITASCYSSCVAHRAYKNGFKAMQAEQMTPLGGAIPTDNEDWEVLKGVTEAVEIYEDEVLMEDEHAIINYVMNNEDAFDPESVDQEMIERVNAIRSKYVNPFGLSDKRGIEQHKDNASASHNLTKAGKITDRAYGIAESMKSEDVGYEMNKLQLVTVS